MASHRQFDWSYDPNIFTTRSGRKTVIEAVGMDNNRSFCMQRDQWSESENGTRRLHSAVNGLSHQPQGTSPRFIPIQSDAKALVRYCT